MNQFDINLIFLNLPEIHREVKEIGRVRKRYILFDPIKLLAHCIELILDCSDCYGSKEYSEEAVEACDKLI